MGERHAADFEGRGGNDPSLLRGRQRCSQIGAARATDTRAVSGVGENVVSGGGRQAGRLLFCRCLAVVGA